MSWRFRIYRWLYDRPGLVVRWAMLNLGIFLGSGVVVALVDTVLGRLEMRWGLTVWFGFLVAFFGMVAFNVITNLFGLGYQEWRERNSGLSQSRAGGPGVAAPS